MNSFQNLAVGCALCSPPGGQGNSKNAVVDAGLSVGLWAAFWGEIAGLIPAGQKLSPWDCSLALFPAHMWQMATTSESQKLFIRSVIILQCVFP